ncbi:unnamed protein product [Symbiodinium sp. CCMP2592]|nr:unnamed protein product [Symbiodinium sp. CCMP2592]
MPAATGTGKKVRVWRLSGEEAAIVAISENLSRVHHLKQHLQLLLGVPRFRQRVLHGNVILDDYKLLGSNLDLQLVVLPFITTSERDADRFIRSVYSGYLVGHMLQNRHDPNLAVDFFNERLTPIQAAAKQGHRRSVSLLLEAGGDRNGALRAALGAGQVQIVRMLWERPGSQDLTTRAYRDSLAAASTTHNEQGFFDWGWPWAVQGSLVGSWNSPDVRRSFAVGLLAWSYLVILGLPFAGLVLTLTAVMTLNFKILLLLLSSRTMAAAKACKCGCGRRRGPHKVHQNALAEARPWA